MRIRDQLFLIFAALMDIVEEGRDPLGLASLSYKQVYGFVPEKLKKHNFTQRVSYALKVGSIEKEVKNEEVFLKLTGKGREKLTYYLPLFFYQKKKWDGKWRVLVFDIEETRRVIRQALRRKLIEMGFGMMQKSVYISPLPIEKEMRKFLVSFGLGRETFLFVAGRAFSGDDRLLASLVWHLESLNKEYRIIYDRLSMNKGIFKEDDKKAYLELLTRDPFFPSELLPQPWYRDKIRETIKGSLY